MDGFALLVGHLVGDYIIQNDWMASNKTNQPPGPCPVGGTREEYNLWREGLVHWWLGHITCTIHAALYTLSITLVSFWWMPLWGYIACFLLHWIIDRYRLAREWMRVIGQEAFATGPLSPWSIIVVDNVWHLVTLLLIAAISGRLPT